MVRVSLNNDQGLVSITGFSGFNVALNKDRKIVILSDQEFEKIKTGVIFLEKTGVLSIKEDIVTINEFCGGVW